MSTFHFDDLDSTLISMELGRPRILIPEEDVVDTPLDRDAWLTGFSDYAEGRPATCPARHGTETQSYLHGYHMARVADLLGAVTPPGLPTVDEGESPLRQLLIGGGPDVLEDGRPSMETAHDLCPYEDEEKGEAWIKGFMGTLATGVPPTPYREGRMACEQLQAMDETDDLEALPVES